MRRARCEARATPAWPKGETHKDEYFGEQEIYRGTVDIPVPITFTRARARRSSPLELKLQGCADAGLCYPPLTWKTEVAAAPQRQRRERGPALAASNPPGASTSATTNSCRPTKPSSSAQRMERPDSVALTWIIADGYYLYKDRIKVTSDTPNVQTRHSRMLPKGKPKHDEFFGDTEVYLRVLEASAARRARRGLDRHAESQRRRTRAAPKAAFATTRSRRTSRSSCRRPTSRRPCPPQASAPLRDRQPAHRRRRAGSSSRRSCATAISRTRCCTFFGARLAAVAHAVRAADDSDPLRHHRRPGRQA